MPGQKAHVSCLLCLLFMSFLCTWIASRVLNGQEVNYCLRISLLFTFSFFSFFFDSIVYNPMIILMYKLSATFIALETKQSKTKQKKIGSLMIEHSWSYLYEKNICMKTRQCDYRVAWVKCQESSKSYS